MRAVLLLWLFATSLSQTSSVSGPDESGEERPVAEAVPPSFEQIDLLILPPPAILYPPVSAAPITYDGSCQADAGYLWCAAKRKCLRAWEEDCLAFGTVSDSGVLAGGSTYPPEAVADTNFVPPEVVPANSGYIPPAAATVYVPPVAPVVDGGLYVPQVNGGLYVPQVDGGLYVPPINGGLYVPPIDGGLYVPQVDGGLYVPQVDGGLYVPPIDGGLYVPPIDGGLYVPPIEGNSIFGLYVPPPAVVPLPETTVLPTIVPAAAPLYVPGSTLLPEILFPGTIAAPALYVSGSAAVLPPAAVPYVSGTGNLPVVTGPLVRPVGGLPVVTGIVDQPGVLAGEAVFTGSFSTFPSAAVPYALGTTVSVAGGLAGLPVVNGPLVRPVGGLPTVTGLVDG